MNGFVKEGVSYWLLSGYVRAHVAKLTCTQAHPPTPRHRELQLCVLLFGLHEFLDLNILQAWP